MYTVTYWKEYTRTSISFLHVIILCLYFLYTTHHNACYLCTSVHVKLHVYNYLIFFIIKRACNFLMLYNVFPVVWLFGGLSLVHHFSCCVVVFHCHRFVLHLPRRCRCLYLCHCLLLFLYLCVCLCFGHQRHLLQSKNFRLSYFYITHEQKKVWFTSNEVLYVGLENFKSDAFVPVIDMLKKYKHIR